MRKGLLKGSLLAGVTILTGAVVAGMKITHNVLFPNTCDYYQLYKDELERGRFDKKEFFELEKEEIFIPSEYGYHLHGYYFNQNSSKTVIIVHGITSNLWGSMKYFRVFYDRGFNVLVYDHRNHGLSGGDYTTVGHFESDDLVSVIKYVKKRYGSDTIGLHGESMGAGTSMMALSKTKEIDFLIEDCGYHDIYSQLHDRLSIEYNLPDFPFMQIARLYGMIRYRVDLFSHSPIKGVSQSEIPILFIHGDSDAYVQTNMVHKLYEAKKDKKELHLFKDSKHAASFVNHPNEYDKIVGNFLEKYNFS